jgi:hypothetical protein
MFRIDNATAIPGPPVLPPPTTPIVTEPPTPGTPGGGDYGSGGRFFTDGIAAGRAATLIQAEWLNMVQEELCQVVESTGVVVQKDPTLHANGPYSQFATAIRLLTDADAVGGPPPGSAGNSIEEPDESDPADPIYYDRNRDADETDGYWTRAIPEPPATGLDYNRAVPSGQTPTPPLRPFGEWRRASGQKRIQASDVKTFFVRKAGSNAADGTSVGTAWATIQHAVDVITMDYDANGQIVTVDVGPSNTGDNLPWAGFHVRRPLSGARPHGFRIVGQVGAPDVCEIGPMPRMGRDASGAEAPIPGVFEVYSVYASNGAKIAISGFLFPMPTINNNVFIRAEGNSSAISIERDIILTSRVRPATTPTDENLSTFAHFSAIRGATINLRSSPTLRSTNYGVTFSATLGRRLFHATHNGKILFGNEGVIVNLSANSGPVSGLFGAPHVELRSRSILDFGLTGNLQSGVNYNTTGNCISNECSIASYGNAWETLTPGTTTTGGTRIGGNNPGEVVCMAQLAGDTATVYGATAHRGMLITPREPGTSPAPLVF